MAKTTTLNLRVNPEVKEEAESLYASLGMILTEAVNIFLHKSIMEGGIPFGVRQPRYNRETEAAMAESRDIMSGKVQATSYNTPAEMLTALDEWVPGMALNLVPHFAAKKRLQACEEARREHTRVAGYPRHALRR